MRDDIAQDIRSPESCLGRCSHLTRMVRSWLRGIVPVDVITVLAIAGGLLIVARA